MVLVGMQVWLCLCLRTGCWLLGGETDGRTSRGSANLCHLWLCFSVFVSVYVFDMLALAFDGR